MTKKDIKKTIKKEMKNIEEEYEIIRWKTYGIDEDQADIYNRGWYEAYRNILSMLR